jgi:hypothetical protein
MSETLFKQVNYDLGSLMNYIEIGDIGLPDIQRPFVWKNTKVRDLFDSIYRGFPIGYLLFWQSGNESGSSRIIGADHKQKVPRLLIVDGQQRLTALYAVIHSIPVVRHNYETENIRLAFRPSDHTFEVADAATVRDPEFIPNISELWKDGVDLFDVTDDFIERLRKTREVTYDEVRRIRKAITDLSNIISFPFTALELSSVVDEEQVAEVFVRINSTGKPLNQADFILTLMSVFWDSGRAELEDFCRKARTPSSKEASPYNHFINPEPDQLLRVSVGLGFKRARLNYVYSILRGKDLETEKFSEDSRVQQFGVLKDAQARVLNLSHWHDFMNVIIQAGFRNDKMISSQNNLLFSYILYLIGRTELNADPFQLKNAVASWFFMSSLTGRFTGSPESAMEADLARLRYVRDGDAFVEILNRIERDTLTDDYWSITLPNELATSSSRSPSLFAYFAALNLLDARVLYSNNRVSELLDPATRPVRSPIERHHLFPRGHLEKLGIAETRDTNQIANFAMVEWGDNGRISDEPPRSYAPRYEERFSRDRLEEMRYWHALPDGWVHMEYQEFLEERRKLMAKVIRDGYRVLRQYAERSHAESVR